MTHSLFEWAGVSAAEPIVTVPTVEAVVVAVVAATEPNAAAPTPAGVTRIRQSYAFVERCDDGRYWIGIRHGEWTGSSMVFTSDELRELRTCIDAELAFQQSKGGAR